MPTTKEEAVEFFSKIYGGEHHIPNDIKQWGEGWCVAHFGDLATYDFNLLTNYVLLAHKMRFRVSIQPHHFKTIRICIWKRQDGGGLTKHHPDIDEAIAAFNSVARFQINPSTV